MLLVFLELFEMDWFIFFIRLFDKFLSFFFKFVKVVIIFVVVVLFGMLVVEDEVRLILLIGCGLRLCEKERSCFVFLFWLLFFVGLFILLVLLL